LKRERDVGKDPEDNMVVHREHGRAFQSRVYTIIM